MEKTVKLNNLIKILCFFVFATLLEIINFLWLNFKTSTGATQILPTYFILNLAVYCIIAGAMSLCPSKGANAIMYVFIGLQALINMVNATLFKVFGDIFSFDMMKLGAEAVAAFKFSFIDYWSILANLATIGVLITIQIFVDKKITKEIPLKKVKRKTFKALACVLAVIVGFSSFYTQTLVFADSPKESRVYASDQYLWDNQHFKLESYKKFGTYGFYYKSLANLIYKSDNATDADKKDIATSIKNTTHEVNESATLYGDNLIVIMLESFEWFAIDEYNTPTLWDIKTNSGLSIENFHARNKTNVSEDIVLLGNMPKDTSMLYLAEHNYLNTPYTLPNLFDSLDYQTTYFHSYKKTFYDRDVINMNIGFDNMYALEDVDLPNKSTSFNDWNLDSDFINAVKDELIPTDKKFFSFFTTVTPHGTYARENERFEDYYDTYDANLNNYKTWLAQNTKFKFPQDPDMQALFRQYKCAAMDTDRMVKIIIDDLKAKGLENNTTILMYADHNCYYEDLCFAIKGTQKDDYTNIYNYNVPCMIYSPKLESGVVSNFTNTYDLYPTICNLYGLPYSDTLTQGYDIFSPEIVNSTMISYLTGIFNDKFYSVNIIDVQKISPATKADQKLFQDNASKFYIKQYDIELIYKYGLAL